MAAGNPSENSESHKASKVSQAVAFLEAQGWTWFGLANEGGNIRNEVSICNETNDSIEFKEMYIHWGKVRIPPAPCIKPKQQDECLFHNIGSWSATGSSGIVTYKLLFGTTLHFMWDCPFNFDFYDNFIGLMLTSEPTRVIPDENMFNDMHQISTSMGLEPKAEIYCDLVCCGPSNGDSKEKGGKQPWGHLRTCKVQDKQYKVVATMGDGHKTCSKITILNLPPYNT